MSELNPMLFFTLDHGDCMRLILLPFTFASLPREEINLLALPVLKLLLPRLFASFIARFTVPGCPELSAFILLV